jgi:uncharacterized repeat protein (TIGR01451 family)
VLGEIQQRLSRRETDASAPGGAAPFAATLIWGGSVAGSDPADNVEPFIDDPVLFTTPLGSSAVAPDPVTSRRSGNVTNRGTCSACFYVRTSDVTALVAAAGPGTYAVGRVPATQGTNDNQNGSAGWTLAVLFEDLSQPVRNLMLFLGFEKSGPADQLSGFCTVPSGAVLARVAVTAMEGDARTTGDGLLLGATSRLGDADRLSGPRNPATSFFSGQIADDRGELDTAGTFGLRNQTPGAPVVGARQSWDITNVDATGHLPNNLTTAFVKGLSSGDSYLITALGLQIDSSGPRFSAASGTMTVDHPTAVVGDVLTYTVVLDNTAGTADANNLVFFDTPASGNTFIAGTFAVNGVVQLPADPTVGVPVGTVAAGGRMTITFRVRVGSAPSGATPVQRINRATWTFDYVSCAGQPPRNGAGESSVAITTVPVADLAVTTTINPATAGSVVSYQIVVSNAGPSTATGAVVTDSGTTPALTNVTWTCSTPPGGGCSPASGAGPPVSTLTLPPGLSATFGATGTLPASAPAGTISDTASVTASAAVPDLNLTNNSATASAAIVTRADIAITQTGTATTSPGADVVYTITVTNRGPSDAINVLVADPTPSGLTLVSLTGACALAPGCALPAGGNTTVVATFNVPADFAGAGPIVNVAGVTSATADANTANNSARATTALGSPVADVSIAVTDNVTQVSGGTTTTYTITVTNAGPASAPGTQILDTFDPATFGSAQWQCGASGTSSCTVIGPQTGDIDTMVTIDPGPANAVIFAVQAQVLPNATGTAENTATAAVAANVTDPAPDNDTATDVDAIHAAADLSVSIAGPLTIVPGTTVDYTITVANAGPSTALAVSVENVPRESQALTVAGSGLILSVQAPADATCLSVPVTDANGESGVVPDCTIPVLPPNQTRTFVVRLAIPPDVLAGVPAATSVSLSSSATLRADVDDPSTADHAAVTIAPITPQADVGIMVIGPASRVAGSVASYFIEMANAGPSVAHHVVVDNPIPSGLTVAGGDGRCASGFPCLIDSLAPGDSVTTRIDFLIPIDYGGTPTFMNKATIRSEAQDPNSADDSSSASTLVVAAQADLALAITGPSAVAQGGTIEYVATVTNLGPGPAVNVRTSTVLPAGATFVGGSAPPSPSRCTLPTAGASNLLFCITPSLAVGDVLHFDLVLQAEASLVPDALITLIGTATSPTPDLHAANDRVVVTTRVATADQAELLVEMTDAPDPVIAGSNVTYTIAVRSLGPAMATNVTLIDTLPSGFAFVSATPAQGTCAGSTCSLGTLAPFTTGTVTIVATASGPDSFVNAATVSSDQPDPAPSNNTVTQATTVATADQAHVVIRIQGPTLMQPGESSFYTIEIDNLGPAPAAGVEIANVLPPGFLFYANTEDCVTPFPCEFESLEPGATRTIVTTFTIDPLSAAPANAVITAALTMDSADPTPDTHIVSLTITVDPAGSADLVVTLGDSPDPVYTGTSLSYFMTVANRGPASATAVTLTHALPGVRLISAQVTVGTCSGATVVTCDLGDMPPGSLVRVGVLATAPPVVPATNPMIASATVTSATPDPDPSTNRTTEMTIVMALAAPESADLSVGVHGPANVRAGQSVTYTLTISNAGPDIAAAVSLDDPTPAGLTFVWNAGDCATAFPCALGTIAPGGTRTITATYAVPVAYRWPNPLTNTAIVSSSVADPVPANNAASVVTRVTKSVRCDVNGDGLDEIVTGARPGGGPHVRVLSLAGGAVTELASFYAYDPAFAGGVSVACGDIDGDGLADIVTGAGPGGGPHVRAFSLAGGLHEIASFYTYAPAFAGGVDVAVGDIDGDGLADIVTGAGPGGGPHVRAFSLAGGLHEIASFYAYAPAFPGGVHVAVGDIDGDGLADIVTGAGSGGGPHVRAFSLAGGLHEIASFYAYAPAFPGGVHVAVGDIDGDGLADIVTGAGPGGGPHVRAFSLAGGLHEIASFYAYAPAFPGGVHVAVGDIDGDGLADIVTGAGPGGGPHVRAFSLAGGLHEIASFYAYAPAFTGGVFVADADVNGHGRAHIIRAADRDGGPVRLLPNRRRRRVAAADLIGGEAAAIAPAGTPRTKAQR